MVAFVLFVTRPLSELVRVVILRDMKAVEPIVVVHVFAEFAGIAPTRLHDRTLLGGLLIAAASAAGLHAAHPPTLHDDPERGVDGLLMLEGGHAAFHARAEQHLLFLDIMAPEPADLERALTVFARRLQPVSSHVEGIVRRAPGPGPQTR